MKETFERSSLPTLPGLSNVTSLQGFPAGGLHSDRQDGPTKGPCGVGPRLASRSVQPASAEAFPTKDTSGGNSLGSLQSVTLTQFLANRLQAKTALLGSTLWRQTWRLKTTPSGRVVPALVVLARRTSVNASTGLLTPAAPKLAGWATPIARDFKETCPRYRDGRLQTDVLPRQLMAFLDPEGGGKAQENPGPTNGFWENADWLLCGDGFWRPTKPYALPLAPGLPGRMGRLRGYGNALCVPQAQAFIEAFIDYTLTGEGEAHDSKRVDLQDCQ